MKFGGEGVHLTYNRASGCARKLTTNIHAGRDRPYACMFPANGSLAADHREQQEELRDGRAKPYMSGARSACPRTTVSTQNIASHE